MFRGLLILMVLSLVIPVMAQVSDSLSVSDARIPDYLLADQMAKADASGNFLYFVGGLGLGVYGVLLAALSNPAPNPEVLQNLAQEHGNTFAMVYANTYARAGRQKNLIYAGAGVVFSVSAFILILSYAAQEDDYYDKSLDNSLLDMPQLPIYALPRH